MIFLDGATGTVLQKKGMKPGVKPEVLNIEDPDLIASVHQEYLDAGAEIVYANTFGASRHKLKDTPYEPAQIIDAAVRIARKAAKNQALVALDIGPLGELMEPMGPLRFEEAYAEFREMIVAGVHAGADLVVFETMSDLLEVKAGVLAARENSDLPVFVTMSFEENGRTFTGCTVESMGMTLTGLGVDALGLNCSTGPDKLAPLIKRLASVTDLPIIAKPNAGLPDPMDGHYDMEPAAFVEAMKICTANGASVIGGCCGTSPAYIRLLTKELAGLPVLKRNRPVLSMVCTPLRPVVIDRVTPIGERINPTGKKRFQKALLEEDLDYIVSVALEQQAAGAQILDVNVGFPGVNETEMLPKVVRKLQSAVDLPLQLDSSNPEALEAALRIYNGKPAVNSTNAKEKTMHTIFPLVRKYGASVVCLTMDEDGIPDSAARRIELAEKMRQTAHTYGIADSDLWVDALALTVSAQQEQARETLKAIRYIHDHMHLNTVLGVSNISFGLPQRTLMTRTFLTMAMEEGLRLPIVNPNQLDIMDTISAFEVLENLDSQSVRYIDRFASRPVSAAASASSVPYPVHKTSETAGQPSVMTIQKAVEKGLGKEAADLAREKLSQPGVHPLDLVEEDLIPALDVAGDQYENGRIFLPQLLSCAAAAQKVFEVLRQRLAESGETEVSKGKIVLATVQGDVHDIGKNIVKTVLENYGFDVLDLGRDVSPEKIVQAVQEHHIQLVGLSALMTTTLPAMEKTVQLLKQLPVPPAVMCGGAVVTEEYVRRIGADFYGRDASESAAYARKVFGI